MIKRDVIQKRLNLNRKKYDLIAIILSQVFEKISADIFRGNLQLAFSLEKYQILQTEFLNSLESNNTNADERESPSLINNPIKNREVSFLNTPFENKKQKKIS
jgi:hypothetical protein